MSKAVQLIINLFACSIIVLCSMRASAAPMRTGGIYEITSETFDSGGAPVDGYTGDSYYLMQAIGEPGGITGLSGGAYFMQCGFLGQDFIPPNKVALSSSLNVQSSAFTISWSAPGDDYDAEQLQPGTKIYIASTTVLSDAMNEGFWYSKRNANDCEFIISTGAVNPGDSVSFVISDMYEGSTYYFRLWTLDQACNWSETSSGTTVYFLQAPGTITDLRAYPGMYGRSIVLVWSAPGDNGFTGILSPGSKYAIQRSTWTDVVFSTASADTVFVSTANVEAGAYQSYTLTSLQQGVTYYVRMWTADEGPSWSGVSNSSTAWATWSILSLTIPTTWFNYGWVPTGVSTDTHKAAIIQNTGNIYQTYSMKGASAGSYSMSNLPDEDTFAIKSAFNPTRPANLADFDALDNTLTLSDAPSSSTKFTISGSYTGAGVDPFPAIPADADRNLWFKLLTPLSISTTDYQNIYITITAEEAYP